MELRFKARIGAGVYLVPEERPTKVYSLLAELDRRGMRYCFISRNQPDHLALNLCLAKEAGYWLTSRHVPRGIPPTNLRRLESVIARFASGGQGVVLLDGIEYILVYKGVLDIINCLRRVCDRLHQRGTALLVSLRAWCLEEYEVEKLASEFPALDLSSNCSILNGRTAGSSARELEDYGSFILPSISVGADGICRVNGSRDDCVE